MTPENKQKLKSNFIIIFLFLLVFALPFATSLLLDLAIIQKYLVRQLLIYVLMLVQFVFLSSVFINEIKS